MTATRRALRPALVRLLIVLSLAVAFSGAVAVTSSSTAHAATSVEQGSRAVDIAATRKGALYKMGAAGPTRFDCSGLTQWTYGRIGKALPRTAQQQYRATARVSRSHRRVGDLVFFRSGGRAYHVGVYAGGNRMWHAPKAGDRVKLATMWTSRVKYGRVR